MENNPWDKNAQSRHEQVIQGEDFSFSEVITPTVVNLIKSTSGYDKANVLDVGCGSGIFTHIASKLVGQITGIDSSEISIKIAKEEYKEKANLHFFHTTIENFSREDKYGLIISNMAFQSIERINDALIIISKHIMNNGFLIFSIPHPCFWEFHKPEIREDNYNYKTPSKHYLKFTITNDSNPLPSPIPYYHRPIEFYFNALSDQKFLVKKILEPVPNEDHHKKYNISWVYPRYVIFNCQKILEE